MKEKILRSNIFWIVVIIIIWESVSRLGIISPYVLPPFSKVVIQLVQELQDGSIVIQVINSFRIVLLGLIISLIISIIVLILCDKFKNFEYFKYFFINPPPTNYYNSLKLQNCNFLVKLRLPILISICLKTHFYLFSICFFFC